MELPKTDTELARFLYDALIALGSDDDIAFFCTEEEEKRRYDICKACPFFVVQDIFEDSDEQDEFCKACGCAISSKVTNPLDRCPGNFWTEHFESFRATGYYEISRAIRKD